MNHTSVTIVIAYNLNEKKKMKYMENRKGVILRKHKVAVYLKSDLHLTGSSKLCYTIVSK